MIGNIFNLILFEPIFNGLVLLYRYVGDLGLAIILLTIIIKLLLYLPSKTSIVKQRALQEIQPKIQELQKKYKDNREELGRQMMQLYRQQKVNPLSSCLPLLLQLPILIALYQVFLAIAKTDPGTHILIDQQLQHLYEPLRALYVSTPIQPTFFGIIDLSVGKNIILALLTAGLQFWQSRMLMARTPQVKDKGARDESIAAGVSKQMTYLFPLLTGYITYQFPAGLGLYWVVSTVLTIGQQYLVFRQMKKPTDTKTPIALS